MYTILATKLALSFTGETGTTEQVSEPIEVGLSNTARVDVTVMAQVSAAKVRAYLQESNDLENWFDIQIMGVGGGTTFGVGSYLLDPVKELTATFVRVRYEIDQNAGDALVVSCGLNLSSQ